MSSHSVRLTIALSAILMGACQGSGPEACGDEQLTSLLSGAGDRWLAGYRFEAHSRDWREVNAFLETVRSKPIKEGVVEAPNDPGGGAFLVLNYSSAEPLAKAPLRREVKEMCSLSSDFVRLTQVQARPSGATAGQK